MITLSIGHYKESPGATYDGPDKLYKEHDIAKEWAEYIASLSDEITLIPVGTLKQKVAKINALDPVLTAEIHFNSAKRAIKNSEGEVIAQEHIGMGHETLYYPGSTKGRAIAELVQDELTRVLRRSRGVKEGYYRLQKRFGPDFYLRKTTMPSLIIEPEFIHHIEYIEGVKEKACKAIVEGLLSAQKHLTKGQ